MLIIPLSFDRTSLRVERSERCSRKGDQGVLWRSRDRFSRFPIDQSSRGTTVGVRSDLHFMVERGRWEEVVEEAKDDAITHRVERFGGCCSVVVVVVSSRLLPFISPRPPIPSYEACTDSPLLSFHIVKDRKIVDLSKVSYRILFRKRNLRNLRITFRPTRITTLTLPFPFHSPTSLSLSAKLSSPRTLW